MSSDFGAFWIRVELETAAAESWIARAKLQLNRIGWRIQEADLQIAQSLSSAVSGLNALANTAFAAFDLLGVAIDESLEATISLILSYAQQMALIAASTSAVNPAYAAALATLSATLNARAIQLQAEGQAEAREKLQKAQRLMSQVTQSLIIFTRS